MTRLLFTSYILRPPSPSTLLVSPPPTTTTTLCTSPHSNRARQPHYYHGRPRRRNERSVRQRGHARVGSAAGVRAPPRRGPLLECRARRARSMILLRPEKGCKKERIRERAKVRQEEKGEEEERRDEAGLRQPRLLLGLVCSSSFFRSCSSSPPLPFPLLLFHHRPRPHTARNKQTIIPPHFTTATAGATSRWRTRGGRRPAW